MIALDTNVLLRIFLDIDGDDGHAAVARSAVDNLDEVRVAEIVFTEMLWVLRKRFQVTRNEVGSIGHEILNHTRFFVERAAHLREALKIFEASNVEFTDALALVDARRAQCQLYTFDLKLSRLHGAYHLSPR